MAQPVPSPATTTLVMICYALSSVFQAVSVEMPCQSLTEVVFIRWTAQTDQVNHFSCMYIVTFFVYACGLTTTELNYTRLQSNNTCAVASCYRWSCIVSLVTATICRTATIVGYSIALLPGHAADWMAWERGWALT